uniref:Uncharacterized protein n=1 Tax=Romanomermis culicivorax TaxID=13658 RepID=A0A915IEM8_ROMCU
MEYKHREEIILKAIVRTTGYLPALHGYDTVPYLIVALEELPACRYTPDFCEDNMVSSALRRSERSKKQRLEKTNSEVDYPRIKGVAKAEAQQIRLKSPIKRQFCKKPQ